MHEKRYDIQGLRAWAVIAVVVFHFFPSILPFGYLGVDVFFVLSGFLISLVLENKPTHAISTYANFYFKRIRRIFPLLLLIVLICSVYSIIFYSETLFVYSEKSALHAALFITNLKDNNEGEDYFRDLERAQDLYTHTWSLSVEIQFYLVAPLLLFFFKPTCSKSFHMIGYLLIIVFTSFIYSRFLSTPIAFYSTLARLWQFTAGSIAFHLQNEKQLPTSKEFEELPTYFFGVSFSRGMNYVIPAVLGLSMAICSAIFNTWEETFRVLVTFTASSLLVAKLTTPVLTHRILQIIGDSSYALYLIHWPVVCILKYYEWDSWPVMLVAMILCFVTAFLVYNYYEKWYLTLNEKWTLIFIGILYLASLIVYLIYLYNQREPPPMDTTKAVTVEEVKRLNKQMDDYWEQYLKYDNCNLRTPMDRNPWGFCYLPDGNGTLSFLVIGNSYAANHGRMIQKYLKSHYGKFAVHTVSECEPLIVTTSSYCSGAVKLQEGFLKDIETVKPDVLFLSARYIEPNVPLDAENVNEDTLYKSMMEKLKRCEKNVKKVFILQALPRPANLQKVEDARTRIGKPIEGYMEEAIEADAKPMRKRVEEIAKNCEKCVVYDLMQPHMDGDKFLVSNPVTHLHYFEALRHHTTVGLDLVAPLYQKLSDNFDDLMDSKSPNNVVKWTD